MCIGSTSHKWTRKLVSLLTEWDILPCILAAWWWEKWGQIWDQGTSSCWRGEQPPHTLPFSHIMQAQLYLWWLVFERSGYNIVEMVMHQWLPRFLWCCYGGSLCHCYLQVCYQRFLCCYGGSLCHCYLCVYYQRFLWNSARTAANFPYFLSSAVGRCCLCLPWKVMLPISQHWQADIVMH